LLGQVFGCIFQFIDVGGLVGDLNGLLFGFWLVENRLVVLRLQLV
jgi:hypothetical protein